MDEARDRLTVGWERFTTAVARTGNTALWPAVDEVEYHGAAMGVASPHVEAGGEPGDLRSRRGNDRGGFVPLHPRPARPYRARGRLRGGRRRSRTVSIHQAVRLRPAVMTLGLLALLVVALLAIAGPALAGAPRTDIPYDGTLDLRNFVWPVQHYPIGSPVSPLAAGAPCTTAASLT